MTEVAEGERQRLNRLTEREREEYMAGYRKIAGIDEAGRGPLAGPVVAAVCIIPEGLLIAGINDSKQLTALQRKRLYEQMTSDPRIVYAIGEVDAAEIDRINIYQATIQAMLRAVRALPVEPDLLLVDGLLLPHPTIQVRRIIGGDQSCYCIAAASVIAKEYRDRKMYEYHQRWPHYGFDRNKGYGTEEHRLAVSRVGPCAIHRLTFEPLKSLVMRKGFCSVH